MARRIWIITVAMLVAVAMMAPVVAQAASISTKVDTTYKSDRLYVRKGPHKGNTPAVGTVGEGDKITLLEENDPYNGEAWSKIKVSATGAVGYLKNKYIRYMIDEYGLDNSDGEVDPYEDDGYDYSKSSDNDGKKGSSWSGSSSGSTFSGTKLGEVSTTYGGAVNVRKSASTSSAVLGTASDGELLNILGTSGSWYRVKTDGGLTGYIYGTYVKQGKSAYTTAVSGVNLRKGAGTGYSKIKTLAYGTSVTVEKRGSSWSYVKAGSSYGYISNSYYEFD
ncbi:MAG: SH3 domain-containing protein [Clostridiales bacterium]|nr:SH3 domain-containing protein [Clostridiales bacterium]